MPMKKEEYLVFELEKGQGSKKEHFFSSERYFNEGLKINRLTLLHFHFEEEDYYLFYGKKGYKVDVQFSFQFNGGDAFIEFIKGHGATYHRFDIASILKASYYYNFRLKDHRIVQLTTFANGSTSRLLLYDMSEITKNSKEKPAVLLDLPIAKLDLEKKDLQVVLKSTDTVEHGKLPMVFKDFLAEQDPLNKTSPFVFLGLIVIVVLIIYFAFFL